MISLNVGLVGCGAIGTTIANAIKDGKAGENNLISICDIEEEKLESDKSQSQTQSKPQTNQK